MLIDALADVFNLLLDALQGLRVRSLAIGLQELDVASVEDFDLVVLLVGVSLVVCRRSVTVSPAWDADGRSLSLFRAYISPNLCVKQVLALCIHCINVQLTLLAASVKSFELD